MIQVVLANIGQFRPPLRPGKPQSAEDGQALLCGRTPFQYATFLKLINLLSRPFSIRCNSDRSDAVGSFFDVIAIPSLLYPRGTIAI